MRIVNRAQFLALPANTLFSKYTPCVFGPLEIKGDSFHGDFASQSIAASIASDDDALDVLIRAEELGESFSLDLYCMGRDGCGLDTDQLFAVWERGDVVNLIDRLELCKGDCGD